MKQNFNEIKNNVIKLVSGIASEPNVDEYFKEGAKTFVGIYEKRDLDKNEKLLDERLYYKKLSDIEAKLDPEQFIRSHKSYIINLTQITKIEPYGRWTYIVKFKGMDKDALITGEKYEEIKNRFL